MNIVYLHQYFNTPANGGGTRSYELARRLVRDGHHVDLITADNAPDPHAPGGWRVDEIEGIRVHRFPVPYSNHMGFARRLRAFVAFAAASAARASTLPADVVFASSTPLTIAIPAVLAAKRRRAPMVFEVRDLWPDVPISMRVLRDPVSIWAARRLERFAYRNAREVVALSPGMAAGVARRGVPEERIHVIPNACDLDVFHPDPEAAAAFRRETPWLGDRPLVVYTGAFGRVNGVGYLARLAAEVAELDPEVRFLAVGDGLEREAVASLAHELGVLERSFFLLPKLPKPEVARILAAADVATSVVIDVPALWDNSANKFFDGLASGTAFAVNHEGWQADLLRASEAGLVLHATDLQRAARQLVDALATPGWAARAGAQARRLAEARFARDTLAAQLEAVLRGAASA